MKVDDLQDMINVIRQLLTSAGAGSKASELTEFCTALDPFRDLTVKQLTKELTKLTEHPSPGGKGGKKAKISAAEVDALIATVRDLYARAGSPTAPTDVGERTRLLDSLSKKDAVRAAESVGLTGMKNHTIPEIAEAIRKRIGTRTGAAHKMEMINVLGDEDS